MAPSHATEGTNLQVEQANFLLATADLRSDQQQSSLNSREIHMKKITYDAEEANEAMRHRFERFEALACHVYQGIKDGITAHDKHEASYGFLPATPVEVSQSIAEAIATGILKSDPASVERFIEDLRLSISEDPLERIDTI